MSHDEVPGAEVLDAEFHEREPGLPAPQVRTVEPGYIKVLRVQTLMAWVPPLIGALVLDRVVLADTAAAWMLPGVLIMVAATVTSAAPPRMWARLGYALEPDMLRVVRGWMWHVDTLVPLARVQHLDIARGPLDKLFGTASLVVHTAGTHNCVVSLPGLSPQVAGELADVIRGHVVADLD